ATGPPQCLRLMCWAAGVARRMCPLMERFQFGLFAPPRWREVPVLRSPPLLRAPRRDRPSAAGELDRDRSVRVDVQVDAAADVGPLDVDGGGGDVPRRQVDALQPRNARHGAPGPVLAGGEERRGEGATGQRAGAG